MKTRQDETSIHTRTRQVKQEYTQEIYTNDNTTRWNSHNAPSIAGEWTGQQRAITVRRKYTKEKRYKAGEGKARSNKNTHKNKADETRIHTRNIYRKQNTQLTNKTQGNTKYTKEKKEQEEYHQQEADKEKKRKERLYESGRT